MVTIENLKAQKARLESRLDPHYRMSDDHQHWQKHQRILDNITQLTLFIADYPEYKRQCELANSPPAPEYSYSFTYELKKMRETLAKIRVCNGTFGGVKIGLQMRAVFSNERDRREFIACLSA